MICLDTNAVIAAINGRQIQVRARLQAGLADGMAIGIPAIVLYELWYGVWKSARPKANARQLEIFLTLDLERWAFEPADAAEAGDIRAKLERAGTPIGAYDLLIAAQARRRKATLVTANLGEFSRVPGLTIESWI
jgi:tRNA(fMet)-specific endonuclease VapC